MLKKLLSVFCLMSGIFLASTKIEAASQIKIGVVMFDSPAELTQSAVFVTDNLVKNLSDSNAITVITRPRFDKEYNVKDVSNIGKTEDCQYMLIGFVNRDKDVVINIRAIDVKTTEVIFSMSATSQSSDSSSLFASISKLGDRIRERLTGEYPKVSSVEGKNIFINRGSSSGIRKGNLYRVYMEYLENIDKSGNTVGKNVLDLAIIEIKNVKKDSSVANLIKNGGDTKILPRLTDKKIESISKEEAKKLIRQKKFSAKKIDEELSERLYNYNSFTVLHLNPNLLKSKLSESELKITTEMAEKGFPAFQEQLGRYYMNNRNFPLALKWFRKAAEQDNISAYNNLGYMYLNGLGVEQNYQNAFNWLLKAAEQGDAPAQNNIGMMYKDGKGVKQDYKQAIFWLSKSVAQDYHEAKNNLGYMYENGFGVKQDLGRAEELYNEAAQNGVLAAKYNLGGLYSNSIPYVKTSKERETMKNAAYAWLQSALKQAIEEQNDSAIQIIQEELNELSRK